MVHNQKPDATEFSKIIEALQNSSKMSKANTWCPYLYHNTSLENAISILKYEKIFSRKEAAARSIEFKDIANQGALQATASLKDYVRFYFRPETPTCYTTEGIKPSTKLEYPNVHCPIPVFFLFDSASILGINNTYFTSEHYSNNRKLFSTAKEFQALAFENIYSDGGWGDSTSSVAKDIKSKRQAEVLVPKELALTHLKKIFFRSLAEYETFTHLLPPILLNRWQDLMTFTHVDSPFCCEWLFVKQVYFSSQEIVINFNIPLRKEHWGPFDLSVNIHEFSTNLDYKWSQSVENISKYQQGLPLLLSNLITPDHYRFELKIDNNLVYMNDFFDIDNIPF